MARPDVSEWETVFGFSDDPTPGDPEMLGRLAGQYRSVADDADQALPIVNGLKNKDFGEGKAMDKLRGKVGDLAGEVEKLQSSYDLAAGTLKTYSGQLTDHQQKADHALAQGRDAKVRLDQATDAAAAAGSVISGLDSADPPPPHDDAARRSARQAMENAKNDQASADAKADSAQADLDAARMLAEDARELRETDAATAANSLDDARHEAVHGYSLWDKIKNIFKTVLGILSAILGFIAMFIPGLQGLGLFLTIASLVTAAIPFVMTIVDNIKSGQWDVLDMVLSGLGLVLGGFSLFKIAGLSGITNVLKSIGNDIKAITVNVKSVIPTIKAISGIIDPLKFAGGSLSDIITKIPNITNIIGDMTKGLPDITNFWTKFGGPIDKFGEWVGEAGFVWTIGGLIDSNLPSNTTVNDPSYLPTG